MRSSILARKTGSAADKAMEHHGREGKRIFTGGAFEDRKGAVMTAVLSVSVALLAIWNAGSAL